MAPNELSINQQSFLRRIIRDSTLTEFIGINEFYDFNFSFDIEKCIKKGKYWTSFNIIAKINEILLIGSYNENQKLILSSVRTFVINKDEIYKINR